MFTRADNTSTALLTLQEEPQCFDSSIKVIERKLDPKNIHSRTQGKVVLKYISGTLVTYLLNEAFNYRWSFEVLHHEIVQCIDKPIKDWNTKEITGQEPQPPYALVLGRLTVPGFGVKEQYGSQQLNGGVAEQANAIKGAATDALKKCASLIGIGAELYGESKPGPAKAKKPVTPAPKYDKNDVAELQELKIKLEIKDNSELNGYVIEWIGDEDATYENITPTNIASFIKFLKEKEDLT